MYLRIYLIACCLFGIGIFSNAQEKKHPASAAKPTVENGADAIPVTVTSSSKKNKPQPPKAPEPVKFTAPTIEKNGEKGQLPPPPQPPMKHNKGGDMPPPPPPPPSKNHQAGELPPPPPPPLDKQKKAENPSPPPAPKQQKIDDK